MNQAEQTRSRPFQHRPAAERVSSGVAAAAFADHRPDAIVQRELAVAIDRGPHATAQRVLIDGLHGSPAKVVQLERLAGMFGKAAQLEAGPAQGSFLQRKPADIQLQDEPAGKLALQGRVAPVQRLKIKGQPGKASLKPSDVSCTPNFQRRHVGDSKAAALANTLDRKARGENFPVNTVTQWSEWQAETVALNSTLTPSGGTVDLPPFPVTAFSVPPTARVEADVAEATAMVGIGGLAAEGVKAVKLNHISGG
jgi:hypothetical protein